MILLQAAKGENGMKRKRGFSLVLCLFLLSCLLPQAVGAERIDPERKCSLTVELFEDGAPVEGFPFPKRFCRHLANLYVVDSSGVP